MDFAMEGVAGKQRIFILNAIYSFLAITVASVSFSVAVSSIAMGTAIVLWAYYLVVSKGHAFPHTPLDLFFLFYLVAEILSTVFSVEPAASFVNMKRLFLISILYLALLSLDTELKLKGILSLLIGVAALLSVMEIFSLTSIAGHFIRVSLFQYFLTEGGIKMILLLLALSFIIHPFTPKLWRILAITSAVPLLIGLILTQTRSSWLGLIAGALTLGIIKNKKLILFVLAFIIIFVLLAPTDFRERAASIFDPTTTSNLTRIHMITTGWRMFLDYPLVGTGDIDLRKLYVTYITPLNDAEGGHLHNNFMMLLVTLGFIGFFAIMAIFIKIFLAELEIVRGTRDHWLYGSTALGCLAAYVGFHVNGLFEWNFGDHEIAVLLWFTVGAALVSQRLHSITRRSTPTENNHNLSVIVITQNEESNIVDCLQSVAWANDIVVVDSKSVDRTVELAKQFTQKVFVTDWLGYGAAKNFALQKATNEWVLWLDADERLTLALASEIQEVIRNDSIAFSGFEVARRAFFLGRWIKHCGWYPGYVVRLFRRIAVTFNTSRVHEKLEYQGAVGRLKNDILHYTDETLFHYLSKFNRYTSLAAEDLIEARKKFSLYDVLVRPPFLFFKMYVLRLGFLDGMHGLILCLLSSAYVFTKYAKLWEGTKSPVKTGDSL